MREESDGDKTYKYSDAQFIKETKPKQLPSSHGCSIRDHRPMYERIGDLLRARAERLRALQEKQKILDEELFTFKPVAFSRTKKNKSSRKKTMTDEGEQKEPVHVRLLNEGEKLLKRKKELFNKREDEISSMMTNVKPCHGSELILQEKYRETNFEDRQTFFREQVKKNSELRVNKQEDYIRQNFFKPRILKSSKRWTKLNNVTEGDSVAWISRLSAESVRKRHWNLQALEEQVYGQLNFKPQVNALSKELVRRSRSLDDLTSNASGRAKRLESRQRCLNYELRECTFKPRVLPRPKSACRPQTNSIFHRKRCELHSDHLCKKCDCKSDPDHRNLVEEYIEAEADNRTLLQHKFAQSEADITGMLEHCNRSVIDFGNPEKMMERFRFMSAKREEWRRQELQFKEAAQLQDCSFHPSPFRPAPCHMRLVRDNVPIRGIHRHLELREMKEKQVREKREIQDKIFCRRPGVAEKYRDPATGTTIVNPFVLRYSEREISRLEAGKYKREDDAATTSSHRENKCNDEIQRKSALKKLLEIL